MALTLDFKTAFSDKHVVVLVVGLGKCLHDHWLEHTVDHVFTVNTECVSGLAVTVADEKNVTELRDNAGCTATATTLIFNRYGLDTLCT